MWTTKHGKFPPQKFVLWVRRAGRSLIASHPTVVRGNSAPVQQAPILLRVMGRSTTSNGPCREIMSHSGNRSPGRCSALPAACASSSRPPNCWPNTTRTSSSLWPTAAINYIEWVSRLVWLKFLCVWAYLTWAPWYDLPRLRSLAWDPHMSSLVWSP